MATINGRWLGKYRIPSARATWWNYSQGGCYFVTICTQDRQHFFGVCQSGELRLSESGEIAHSNWLSMQTQFPFAEMGKYVVMPNHLHGIIYLRTPEKEILPVGSEKLTLPPNSLGAIVRAFKAKTSTQIRKTGITSFQWQSGYWDRILTTDEQIHHVENYIDNNPQKWEHDLFFIR